MSVPAEPGPLDRASTGQCHRAGPQGFVATVMRRVHDAQAHAGLAPLAAGGPGDQPLSSAGVDPASIATSREPAYAATGIIMKKIVWGWPPSAQLIVSMVWLGYPRWGRH